MHAREFGFALVGEKASMRAFAVAAGASSAIIFMQAMRGGA